MRRPLSIALTAGVLCSALMTGCYSETQESQIPQVTVPVAAQGDFIIGVICEGNKREPEGFEASHIEAINAAAEDLGVSTVRISDEVTGDTSVRNAVDELAEYGCDVIFDVDFDHMEAFAAAAEEYPDIAFCQYGGYLHNDTNLISYGGRMYQASYLSGIAEGYRTLASGSNETEYVTFEEAGPSHMNSMINAFALGVQAVNPNATVDVQIVEQQDGPVVIDNSELYTYPVEDLRSFYETAISTSMYEASASEFVSNMGGDYYGSLSDGYVGISELSSVCPAEVPEAIALTSDLIQSGQWDVFSGTALSFSGDAGSVSVAMNPSDIEDTDGNTVVEAGETSLPDTVIRAYMNYYVEGVS